MNKKVLVLPIFLLIPFMGFSQSQTGAVDVLAAVTKAYNCHHTGGSN